MGALLEQIAEWLKGMLIDGIMNNLSGMFDAVNRQVADVATQVGSTPASFSPGVFALVRNISESVIIPIAFLTFIACYELIQLIIEHNNLANFETWIFFKWIFKTFVAVMLITNTFNIVMAVFDVAQYVVNSSAGLISGSTAVDAATLETIRESLEAMELGALLGLFLQSFIVQICSTILSVAIFVIVYGRMMEIYLMTSLAPIPWKPGTEPYRAELFESPDGPWLPGIPDHDLYRHLCGIGPDGRLYGRHHRKHLGRHGIHGAFVLLTLQDRKPGKIRYECPLRKEVPNGSIYPRPEGSDSGQNQSIFKPHKEAAHLLRSGGTHRCAVILFDQKRRLNEPCSHEHDHHHDSHVPFGNVRARRAAP